MAFFPLSSNVNIIPFGFPFLPFSLHFFLSRSLLFLALSLLHSFLSVSPYHSFFDFSPLPLLLPFFHTLPSLSSLSPLPSLPYVYSIPFSLSLPFFFHPLVLFSSRLHTPIHPFFTTLVPLAIFSSLLPFSYLLSPLPLHILLPSPFLLPPIPPPSPYSPPFSLLPPSISSVFPSRLTDLSLRLPAQRHNCICDVIFIFSVIECVAIN